MSELYNECQWCGNGDKAFVIELWSGEVKIILNIRVTANENTR